MEAFFKVFSGQDLIFASYIHSTKLKGPIISDPAQNSNSHDENWTINDDPIKVRTFWHVGNLPRHTKGTVGAQLGHVSSSSRGTVGAQLGQKAQYGHSMARLSMGTVWAQLGHERVTFQKRRGHSWGTVGAQLGHSWGIVGAQKKKGSNF